MDPSTAAVRYTITVDDPRSHLFRVRIEVRDAPIPARLAIPSWTPGSYLMREFARQVATMSAFEPDATDQTLDCRKVDRASWQIEHRGDFAVEYTLNAQERTVRTPYLDDEWGFFIGPNLLGFVDGATERRCEVSLQLPEGWTGYCSRIDGFEGTGFSVPDYDALADTAVLVAPERDAGTTRLHHFDIDGTDHGFVVAGTGEVDLERVLRETRACVRSAARVFSSSESNESLELPYPRYLFILLFTEDYRGGLEHRDSCALAFPRTRYRGEDEHVDLMMLIAHEYFHVWNVKRIYSDVFSAFDYTHEHYTRDLWVGEGWTSYYQSLVARRADVISPKRFLEQLGKRIRAHERKPGRAVQSLEDSSFDAWIKLYRRDANSPNTTISYYLKGSLVAALLDLEIRRCTNHESCLDDVFEYLWREFGQREVGYPEATLQQQVEAVVGGDFSEWFDAYVRGVSPLPWDEALESVGLRRVDHVEDDAAPWLGVKLADDHSTLETVYAGGPAQVGGLMAGDELVALDAYKIEHSDGALEDLLQLREAGDTVTVTFFRAGYLRETRVTLAAPRPDEVRIELAESPSEAQLEALRRWLGGVPESDDDR